VGAPVTLRNAKDAYVNSAHPKKSYGTSARMYLQNGDFGFVFFSRPFPFGSSILSSKTRFHNGDDWNGTVNFHLRLVAGRWSDNKLNWDNRPGVVGPTVTVTKTNADAGTLWEFDTQALMQFIADGTYDWYGFRIDIDGGTRHWVHSTQSSRIGKRPNMVIAWAESPEAPSELWPDHDTVIDLAQPDFRFDFHDVFGDTNMGGYQLRFGYDPTMATWAQDTGDFDSSSWTIDLNTPFYWKVRVKDETDIWSPWSHIASGERISKDTLTWDSPSVASPFVQETTPPFIWTFGGTQTAYRMQIIDPETLDLVFDTGRVTSTDNSVTPPEGIFVEIGKAWTVNLHVWDDHDRANIPNDPPYIEATLDFTFEPTPDTDAVDTISVVPAPDGPWADLLVTCTTAPDHFAVIRDGKVVQGNVDPADVVTSPGHYTIPDRKIPPRSTHTWSVARVVNHQMSDANPTDLATIRAVGPWLFEPDGSHPIMLLNAEWDPGYSESSEVVYPKKGKPFVVIQSLWGPVGTMSGLLTDENIPGVTAKQLRDRWDILRKMAGATLHLTWADQSEAVVIYNTKIIEHTVPNGSTDYEVSFGYVVV
jgi:hypothetical protein